MIRLQKKFQDNNGNLQPEEDAVKGKIMIEPFTVSHYKI